MCIKRFLLRCIRFINLGETQYVLRILEYFLIVCILSMLLLSYTEKLATPFYTDYVLKKVKDVLENEPAFVLVDDETNITSKPNEFELRNLYMKSIVRGNTIYNQDIHGPITENTVVILIPIQVITIQMKFLLISLAKVRGIDEALIIFSHTHYHEETNKFIRSLKFCKVMQVFYPYPIRVFTDQFPAFTAKDCPHNMPKEQAEEINCTSAWSPDLHGKYRDPRTAELKHHWWWTANQVFDGLQNLKHHTGIVVFFYGDYYVTEDFIYMLLFLKHTCEQLTKCDMLSLTGNSIKEIDNKLTAQVAVTTWEPGLHTKVMAFTQKTWDIIVAHFDKYCVFDDYSWARSLFFISLNQKLGTRFRVASAVVPRAYPIYTESSVESSRSIEHNVMRNLFTTLTFLETLEGKLYPPYLLFDVDIDLEYDEFVDFDYLDNNGGWGDPRDRNLCIRMTVNKMKKVFLDMASLDEKTTYLI